MTAGTTVAGEDREPGEGRGLDRLADVTLRPVGPLFPWAVALAAVATATGLRLLLAPWLSPGVPFVTYFPAVAIAAVLAGARSGSLALALSLLAAWLLFIEPAGAFPLDGPSLVAASAFAIVGVLEIALAHAMRRALRRMAAAEAQARATAETRTLMFQELQHRVSNNLAVVVSLLQLERRGVKDPDAARALDGAVARVNLVSRLNRLLHDPQAQAVDFGAFLRAVVPDVCEAAGTGERVRVLVEAEPVVVPAAMAVPLGLVVVELLSNALGHGFPEGRCGRVRVLLRREGALARLEVRDDGVGLPQGFDLGRTRSLGLTVARLFAEQLGATLSIRQEDGVVSSLALPAGG